MENHVASAAVLRTTTKTIRLPNNASILEHNCMQLHLYPVSSAETKQRNLSFSDFMSCLRALNGFKLELELVQHIKSCDVKPMQFTTTESHLLA